MRHAVSIPLVEHGKKPNSVLIEHIGGFVARVKLYKTSNRSN